MHSVSMELMWQLLGDRLDDWAVQSAALIGDMRTKADGVPWRPNRILQYPWGDAHGRPYACEAHG